MDIGMIANILRLRRALRHRERWTRERLLEYQHHELAALRAFADERSPFYRRWYRGLDAAPLAELPVLTKAIMMDHFDEIVTVPRLRLAELQRYLEQLHGNEPVRRTVLGFGDLGQFRAQERDSQRRSRVGHDHRLVRAGE